MGLAQVKAIYIYIYIYFPYDKQEISIYYKKEIHANKYCSWLC